MSSPNKTELIAAVGNSVESTATSPTRNTPSVKNEINIQLGHNKTITEDGTVQDDSVFNTETESQQAEDKERPASGIIEEKYLEEAKQVLESESDAPEILVEEEEKAKSNSSSVDESTYEQVDNILETPIESAMEPDNSEQESTPQELPEVKVVKSQSEQLKETPEEEPATATAPFYITYKKELAVLGTILVAGAAVILRNRQDSPES